MSNLVQNVDGKKVIASGLPGPVFQAAVETRGVFADEKIANNMAGAMYICTGNTISKKYGTGDDAVEYNIPEVVAVKGPDNPPKDSKDHYYKISITFGDDGKVTDAKLFPA